MYRVGAENQQKAVRIQVFANHVVSDLLSGYLLVPPNVDMRTFVLSGGRATASDYPRGIPETPSFTEAVARYLSRSTRASTTIAVYRCHFRTLMRFHGSGVPLLPFDVESYVRHRIASVRPYTVRQELITLRVLLQSEGLEPVAIPALPVDSRVPFSGLSTAQDGRRVLLDDQDVSELRTVVRERGSQLIADVVDLVSLTALRRSEVCRLLPCHLDLEAGQLTVPERKRVHGAETYRTLPLHEDLLAMLTSRRHRSPVFTGSPHTLTSGLKRAIRGTRFELPGFGYHSLRHSAASRLLAQGVAITVVSALLGHATPATTLKVYSHAFDSGLADAVGRL
jgi:integrase